MMLDPDAIADRRRLKRRLGFWRIAAFSLAVVAAIALAVRFGALGGGTTSPHVARVALSGLMTPNADFVAMLDGLADADAVKGVIIDIDSPGGATTAGESVYGALRRLSAKKPTVAWVGTLAASAGYMAALGADRIVIRRSALTGSIGVLVQWPDVSRLMDMIGVKYEEVKSSPMKAEPMPFKPVSPEARAMLDRAIRDTYQWFVGLVAERRGLTPERALELADGRVVTGHQAIDLKLVDEIGEESAARAWLTTKGVAADLPIRDHKPKKDTPWAWMEEASAAATRGVAAAFGLEGVSATLRSLDGLQSVWHPARDENPSNFGGIGR
ncbi:MAG: signal peptide peptidase SppA [Phyllobacteriaceae bacterium]|nr:signal peptide peptidase SppA [Phyllobacteriaceae bacterium]